MVCLKTVAELEIWSGYTWVPGEISECCLPRIWGLWEPEESTKRSWEWGNVGCLFSCVNNLMTVLYTPVSCQIKSSDLMPHRHKKSFVWEGQECRSPVALLWRCTHPEKQSLQYKLYSMQEACPLPVSKKINTFVLVKKRDGMERDMLRELEQETLVLVFCPLSDRDGSRPIGFIFPFWFCLFLSQWKGEIQEFCPNTKMLLVGCKSDRRTDLTTLVELSNHRQTPVSYDQVSGSHKLLLQFGWMPVRHSTLAWYITPILLIYQ